MDEAEVSLKQDTHTTSHTGQRSSRMSVQPRTRVTSAARPAGTAAVCSEQVCREPSLTKRKNDSLGTLPPSTADDGYRFEHFTLPLMVHDLRFSRDSLAPGDVLPNSPLIRIDGTHTDLRALAADRPLVLIVGSVSCPMTISSMPKLVELEQEYGGQMNFVLVYTREAHPGANYGQAQTLEDKIQYARDLQDLHGVSWPVLVDDLDGPVHRLLDMKQNSVHIISEDGTIIFRALFAADGAVEHALQAVAAGQDPRKSQGMARLWPALVGVGYISEVLERAGRGAYLDVLKQAPPMALLGTASKAFPWVKKTRRGLVVVALMGALSVAALVLAW